MSEEPLIRRLADVLNAFASAGLIVTGELSYVRPKTPGIIDHVSVTANLMDADTPGLIVATAIPATPKPSAGNGHPVLVSRKDTGALCVNCGSPDLQAAGSCLVCRNCGSTTSCG